MDNDLSTAEHQHSERFIEMASRTNRLGVLQKPDGYGKRVGDCGDTIELYLSVRGDRIAMITFQIQGCLNTNACANTLAYLVEGRSVADSWQVTPENVMNFLQSLPPDHAHCAELVVGAFYLALNDYHRSLRHAWQKAYPKR